jgi:endonuclease/exonuclease/phosphatase family metal-dependent hydrolase
MSYNIRYDNPEESTHPWRKRRDQVASVIRFHEPDVVGLQEALHDQLEDLRERLPEYEWLSAGREEPECAGEYAAIGFRRDRFNLEAEGTMWLSETPEETASVGWDAQLPRLVRHVRLREETSDVEFYVFNTHFDHYGETARIESASLLLERVDDLAANEPVVVTGDFNCLAGSPPYELLTSREKRSAGRTLRDTHQVGRRGHHGPTTTVTDFRNLVPERKIDHVFVSTDVESVGHGVCSDCFGDGAYPSDHLPVLVDLSLPENDTAPASEAAGDAERANVPSEDR